MTGGNNLFAKILRPQLPSGLPHSVQDESFLLASSPALSVSLWDNRDAEVCGARAAMLLHETATLLYGIVFQQVSDFSSRINISYIFHFKSRKLITFSHCKHSDLVCAIVSSSRTKQGEI